VIRLRFDLWEFGLHSFRIETRDLNGETIISAINGNIEVKGVGNASAVSHLVFCVSKLYFMNPGLVNFVLFIDDKEIGSIPLYVKKSEKKS
jgi:hypothetical protein